MHNLAAHSLNSSCLLTSHEVLAISCEKHGNYTLSVWLMDFRQIFPWCHVLSLFLLSLCGVPFVVDCWDKSGFSSGIHLAEAFSCHSLPLRPLNYSNSRLFPRLSPEMTVVLFKMLLFNFNGQSHSSLALLRRTYCLSLPVSHDELMITSKSRDRQN